MIDVVPSSGNVFADLGLPDPELELAKAKLALAISRAITENELTETEASQMTGIDQQRLSALMRGQFDEFTIEFLIAMLLALGQRADGVVPFPARVRWQS